MQCVRFIFLWRNVWISHWLYVHGVSNSLLNWKSIESEHFAWSSALVEKQMNIEYHVLHTDTVYNTLFTRAVTERVLNHHTVQLFICTTVQLTMLCPQNSHRGEAVPVRRVREVLLPGRQPQDPQAHPHRRKALQVVTRVYECRWYSYVK